MQGAVRSDASPGRMYGNPANSYGAMYFKLNPKGAEYRYFNTAGQLLDQGTIACSGAAADTTAPTAPGNLAAATSASGHVALSWTAAWDETGVAGYGIYRDGVLVGTVGGGETSYVDMNVGLNVTYSYQVDAVDPGGRRSAHVQHRHHHTRPSQATLIFNPTADTYVQSDVPTTNYGTAITLKVDASPDTQSFLRFNVQGIAGTINSATLRLYANNGSSTGYQVFPLTSSSWTETGTTYNDKPATGSLVATSGSFTSGSWTEANLLPLVTGNGELNIGLKTTSSTSMNFSSREGANPPQLVVNIAAPQPTPTATPVSPTETPSPTAPDACHANGRTKLTATATLVPPTPTDQRSYAPPCRPPSTPSATLPLRRHAATTPRSPTDAPNSDGRPTRLPPPTGTPTAGTGPSCSTP